MKIRIVFAWFSIFFSFLFVQSCAHIGKPSGGNIDKTGPKIYRSSIPNGSTDTRPRQVSFYFDEFVVLNNPTHQVLVSPPLQHALNFQLKGKRLSMAWEDTLKPNTTYSFNMGKAVLDLHENNALENYVFVFGTGENIDSLSLYGRLIDALTLKPVPDMLVTLYADKDDSAIFKRLPDYITRSDENGFYSFMFLRDEPMQLFAYGDDNRNRRFDPPSEKFAFSDTLITPLFYDHGDTAPAQTPLKNTPKEIHLLRVYQPMPEQQGIKSHTLIDPDHWQIVWQRPAEQPSIEWIEPKLSKNEYLCEWNKGKDTLNLYTWSRLDETKYRLVVRSEQNFTDTLHADRNTVETKTPDNKKAPSVAKFKLKSNITKEFPFFETLTLTTTQPIETSIENKFPILFSEHDSAILTWEMLPNHRGVKLHTTLLPDKEYKLWVPDSLFLLQNNFCNDSLSMVFHTTSPDKYGKISLRLESTHIPLSSVYVVLLDSKNKEHLPTKTEAGYYLFEQLPPDGYIPRAWIDANNNQRRDIGEYKEKRLPETILEYQKKLSLRAGWEISETWILP